MALKDMISQLAREVGINKSQISGRYDQPVESNKKNIDKNKLQSAGLNNLKSDIKPIKIGDGLAKGK